MNLDKIPTKNLNRVVSREVGESELLIFLDKESASLLEGATKEVWSLIDDKRSIKDIISKLQEEYDNPAAEVEDNVLESIEQLIKIGVVQFEK